MAGNPLLNQMNNSNMMAMIQNSPIGKMANILKSGGNPQALFQQMMGGNNQQIGEISSLIQGKNPNQIGDEIKSIASQRGVDIGELTKALGVPESALKSMGLI